MNNHIFCLFCLQVKCLISPKLDPTINDVQSVFTGGRLRNFRVCIVANAKNPKATFFNSDDIDSCAEVSVSILVLMHHRF